MRRLRLAVWIVGLGAISVVNAVGAFPRYYKGEQHPVGSDVVSVYTPEGSDGEVTVPVKEWRHENGSFVETGSRVRVYLRNGYKDDVIEWYPRVTLGILVVSMVVNLFFSVIERYGRRA